MTYSSLKILKFLHLFLVILFDVKIRRLQGNLIFNGMTRRQRAPGIDQMIEEFRILWMLMTIKGIFFRRS
jgi:hypothetical protein